MGGQKRQGCYHLTFFFRLFLFFKKEKERKRDTKKESETVRVSFFVRKERETADMKFWLPVTASQGLALGADVSLGGFLMVACF